jgi:hypothetical protein
MKRFRCLVEECEFETNDEVEMKEHIIAAHPKYAGIAEYLVQGAESTQEDLDATEWTDEEPVDPESKEPEVPPYSDKGFTDKYPLPEQQKAEEYPYYPYVKYKENKVFHYLCTDCRFDSTEPDKFFAHMFKSHKEHMHDWYIHFAREKLLQKFRGISKTENIDEEQLQRWAEDDWTNFLADIELTQDAHGEVLANWLGTRDHKIIDWLTGSLDHCPLCGLTKQACELPTYQEQYLRKQIFDSLRKNNPTFAKAKTYNEMYSFDSPGTYNLSEIRLSFIENLHMALRHRPQYESLVSSGKLKGTVPIFLSTFGQQGKVPEELARGLVAGISKLSEKDKKLRDELLKRK